MDENERSSQETQGSSLNDRFTSFADSVNDAMAQWWMFALSVALVMVWLVVGVGVHYQDSWQNWLWDTSTILSFWLEILLLAAANRADKQNRRMSEDLRRHILKIEAFEQMQLLSHPAASPSDVSESSQATAQDWEKA